MVSWFTIISSLVGLCSITSISSTPQSRATSSTPSFTPLPSAPSFTPLPSTPSATLPKSKNSTLILVILPSFCFFSRYFSTLLMFCSFTRGTGDW